MRTGLCLLAMALTACSAIGPAPDAKRVLPYCEPYGNSDAILTFASTHVIMLGEMHGTDQAVEAFSGLVCAALEAGVPVKVGLEAEAWQGPEIDRLLNMSFDETEMIEAAPAMWTTEDGRSSLAIMGLLQDLSVWRASGHDIEVFAFDSTWQETADQEDFVLARSAIMAERVDAAVAGFDGAILLLTGEFHARKLPFDFGNQRYEPMASKVSARPVLSLKMQYLAGEAWVHAGIEKPDGTYEDRVGPLKLSAIAPEGSPQKAFVLEPSEDGLFDGSYFTGPVTASPPAIRTYGSK